MNKSLSSFRGNCFWTVQGRLCKTLLKAVTSGVVPPDIIKDDAEQMGISPNIIEFSKHFDDFKETLKSVPPRTETEHDEVVELNNELIWSYARDQYANKLFGKLKGFTAKSCELFDIDAYGVAGESFKYTIALKNCRKVFARKPYNLFWDAIGIKVQNFRDLSQVVSKDLEITPKEFSEIKDNLVYVGKGFAYNAKITQSRSYITSKSPSQKSEDAKAFQEWYIKKTHALVKIIRLNISDLPLGYATKQIQAFENDPSDAVARKYIESKLIQFQKEAISSYRKAVSDGVELNWSFEDWIDSK